MFVCSCYHASAKQEKLLGRYKIKQEEQVGGKH
jgi:hypothetical protein